MKAQDLIKLLEKHSEIDVFVLGEEDGRANVIRDLLGGLIYEDDGLVGPRLYIANRFCYSSYDEDFQHGFKVEL